MASEDKARAITFEIHSQDRLLCTLVLKVEDGLTFRSVENPTSEQKEIPLDENPSGYEKPKKVKRFKLYNMPDGSLGAEVDFSPSFNEFARRNGAKFDRHAKLWIFENTEKNKEAIIYKCRSLGMEYVP